MKTLKILFVLNLLFSTTPTLQAQFFKKLGKTVKKTAERRTHKEAGNKTDRILDNIFNPKKQDEQVAETDKSEIENKTTAAEESNQQSQNNQTSQESKQEIASRSEIELYKKFNFAPGENVLFTDDFSNDLVGDFPSKWDTNAGGEVIKLNGEKYFNLVNNATVLPLIKGELPDTYTLEFDLMTKGFVKQSRYQDFNIIIDESNNWKTTKNSASVSIPLNKDLNRKIYFKKYENGKNLLDNSIYYSALNQVIHDNPHISIAVNKERFRLWINEKKLIDIPRFIPKTPMTAIKLHIKGLPEDTYFAINNVRLAEGGVDFRKELISNGSFATTGIKFESGSAVINPASYGVIKKIANLLNEDSSLNFKIIGHTDSDGDESSNLLLSSERAAAVKEVLCKHHKISDDRLVTLGMGESQGLNNNASPEEKAANRRVEFIKL